jgi:DNA invertase Pin-like site-specific DNA recombinase
MPRPDFLFSAGIARTVFLAQPRPIRLDCAPRIRHLDFTAWPLRPLRPLRQGTQACPQWPRWTTAFTRHFGYAAAETTTFQLDNSGSESSGSYAVKNTEVQGIIGQRVGYIRVSTIEQNTERQLDGVPLARAFTDHASGKDTNRPELQLCLGYVREGDTLVVHSIDRLARNLTDLRRLVLELTARGVRVEFVKENLTFGGDASPMNLFLLSVMGAFAEFERAIIRERQREGIELAKRRGAFVKGKYKLSRERADELRRRVAMPGAVKARIAREFGISERTLYDYLKRGQSAMREQVQDHADPGPALDPSAGG